MYLGIDIVEIERIRTAICRAGGGFMARVFTPHEAEHIGDPHANAERAAGLWAAKEAAVKALGTGFSAGITFHDVQIAHEDSGRPYCILSGRFAEIARQRQLGAAAVSISHCRTHAVAAVVLTALTQGLVSCPDSKTLTAKLPS